MPVPRLYSILLYKFPKTQIWNQTWMDKAGKTQMMKARFALDNGNLRFNELHKILHVIHFKFWSNSHIPSATWEMILWYSITQKKTKNQQTIFHHTRLSGGPSSCRIDTGPMRGIFGFTTIGVEAPTSLWLKRRVASSCRGHIIDDISEADEDAGRPGALTLTWWETLVLCHWGCKRNAARRASYWNPTGK